MYFYATSGNHFCNNFDPVTCLKYLVNILFCITGVAVLLYRLTKSMCL